VIPLSHRKLHKMEENGNRALKKSLSKRGNVGHKEQVALCKLKRRRGGAIFCTPGRRGGGAIRENPEHVLEDRPSKKSGERKGKKEANRRRIKQIQNGQGRYVDLEEKNRMRSVSFVMHWPCVRCLTGAKSSRNENTATGFDQLYQTRRKINHPRRRGRSNSKIPGQAH